MKLSCTSLYCDSESPVDYCKECSHALWHVKGKTTFNPHFGFSSVYYYKFYDAWLKSFNNVNIKDCSFI